VLTYAPPTEAPAFVTLEAVDGVFAVMVSDELGRRVVHVSGELDIATRNVCFRSCVAGGHDVVVVDMAELTFMDCCGYAGLIAVRSVLDESGGSLTLRNQSGQPARLLGLLSTGSNVHAEVA
jgi:anti-anti-sigma factor